MFTLFFVFFVYLGGLFFVIFIDLVIYLTVNK